MSIGVKLEHLIFLEKMDEIFCGVRVDAKAAGINFWGLETF